MKTEIVPILKQLPQNSVKVLTQGAKLVEKLTRMDTPSDPEALGELNEEEMFYNTLRVNLFEKLRAPVVDDEQLEYLLIRTHELWGEHPTEPLGRWCDWCLWTHLDRRRNGVRVTEVLAGDKTAVDLKRAWGERHQSREERRRRQKVDNYDRYDTPADVPPSVRQFLMSPFIENPDLVDADVDIVPKEQY